MFFLKLNGLVLGKEKIKENDALVYILTKNYGMLKCLAKGVFKSQSKNLGLLEPGNYNRFFLLTDFERFKIISALPLKIVGSVFHQEPYRFLWALRLIKSLKLLETPKFLWFILLHLENYLKQEKRNFAFWFLFHLLKELGYEINLESCSLCQRKLKNFAFFDKKGELFCFYCKKDSYQKIEKKDLMMFREIKNIIRVPKRVPEFLKVILKKQLKNLKNL